MKTREEALKYGLSFPGAYQEFAFGGADQQAKLLMAEGIEVKDGRVDLEKYRWKPFQIST